MLEPRRIVNACLSTSSATPAIAASRNPWPSGSANGASMHTLPSNAARVAVRAVVDRWYSPAQRWFKVEAEDGDIYIVRHDEPSGRWDLAAYTSARSPGTDLRCPTSPRSPLS